MLSFLKRIVLFASTVVMLVALPSSSRARGAELNGRQKRIVEAIDASVRRAAIQFKAGDFQQSAGTIQKAMNQVAVAANAGQPELIEAMQIQLDRIRLVHTLLELEGISLPPFVRPALGAPSHRDPMDAPSADPPGAGSNASSAPSFVSDVAPILVSRCGRCHVERSRGDFSMSTFASLMKGPPAGSVIFPGDVIASRLIATIDTGAMPPNGAVPDEEQQTLEAWILAGAKFDGEDAATPLANLSETVSPTAAEPAAAPIRRATGNETVSFASDVAPLLVDNCNGCHIDARQASGGLRMDTFAQLMRGGDSGAVVAPGDGGGSLLVRKLRGMAGNRMPAGGRPALSEDSIQLIATWIEEGATLDGASEDQPLSVMSQLAWAASATTQQMSERRRQSAAKNVQLAVPDSGSLNETTTEHFFLIGGVSEATLDEVARAAEAQMKAVRRTVSGPDGVEYFSGRVTLFVLPQQYLYSEFAKMVEGRSIPTDWTSHWRYDGIDAYVAVLAGENVDKEELAKRLVAPLTSLAVATRARTVPRWFAEGIGNAVALRGAAAPKGEALREREASTAEAIAAAEKGSDIVEGKLTPEQTDLVATAFGRSLLERSLRRKLNQFLRALDEDEDAEFDYLFAQAFGFPPADFLDRWLVWSRGGK